MMTDDQKIVAYPKLVTALRDFVEQKPHRTYNARELLRELGELENEPTSEQPR